MNYQSFNERERGTKLSFGRATIGSKPNWIGPKHVLKLTQTPKTPIGVVFCSYTPT